MVGHRLRDILLTGVDVPAKLYRLRDNLDGLGEDDRAFVTEMVSLLEKGGLPKPSQVYRICMEISVPGEEITEDSEIWTQGNVSVVYAPLREVIWRYMPLEQLFALLWKKALHFSPLSTMADTTEGQLPPRAWEETMKQPPQSYLEGREAIDADAPTPIMVAQRRTDACISCWFTNESDSLEMWQRYAPNNGVAIQSTVHGLASSLYESDTPIRIIPVTYFAPDEEEQYIFEASFESLFIKHDQYRHERELRALALRTNVGCGVDIPVNLEVLVGRIVLSPELRDWAFPVITETIRRLDFAGPVERSALAVSR